MNKRNLKSTGVRKTIFEAFQFLTKEFDYKFEKQVSEPLIYEIVYKSSSTGVVVTYENKEQYIKIDLYKLIDGKIVKNLMHELRSGEPINGFSLEYIIKTKMPKDQILPVHEYGDDSEFYKGNGFSKYVDLFVVNLKKYATDILKGDFSSFENLDAQFRDDYYKNVKM